MRTICVLLTVLLLTPVGADAADEGSVTRVLYLGEISPQEAMVSLRREVGLRSVASLPSLEAVVVRDNSDRVDRGEELLREREALVSVAEPHGPVLAKTPEEGTTETRRYRLRSVDRKEIVTLLRAIYGVKKLIELPDESELSLTAEVERLERIEATLDTLGVLDSVDP